MEQTEVIKNLEPKFEKVIEDLDEELTEIYTARPSTTILEDIKVEVYGKKVPLKGLAMLSLTKEQEVIIKPWDKSYISSIEKAVRDSVLGFSPITEEGRIRVLFPSFTEDRKKQYIILLGQKAEIAKQNIREVRNNGTRNIEKSFSKKEIGKDDKFKILDELQDMVKAYNEKIEERHEKKRELIMR